MSDPARQMVVLKIMDALTALRANVFFRMLWNQSNYIYEWTQWRPLSMILDRYCVVLVVECHIMSLRWYSYIPYQEFRTTAV